MEEQKVSIIMSCYNAEKTLARAIKSVLGNTYKNIELVIIEDCSTDKSLEIAKEYAERKTVGLLLFSILKTKE